MNTLPPVIRSFFRRSIIACGILLAAAPPFASAGKRQPMPAGPQIPQSVLGNVFLDTEPLVIQCPADSSDYTIKDFWGNTVASGKAEAGNGVALVKPNIKARGYYELSVGTGAGTTELTFAIIAPVDPRKLAGCPFNVCSHFSMGWSTDLIPLMARVGVSEVRDNIGWGGCEKTQGVYDFAGKAGPWVDACKQAGIKVLATGGCVGNKLYGGGFPETPDAAAAYGRYTAAMGEHFGNALSGLELWNEFNGTWGPKNKNADRSKIFADMLKVAYPIIKQGCPNIPVLGCAAVVMPIPYLEGIFRNGGMPCMDGIVIHPYVPQPENFWRDVGAVRDLIRKYNNGQDKPIYATEYGWGLNFNTNGDPTDVAKYLVRGSVILNALNVKSMDWYEFQDEPGFIGQGMVHLPNDPRGKYSPAPWLVSYATLVRAIGGARFEEREVSAPYSSAWVFRFRDKQGETRACWSNSDDKTDIVLQADAPLTRIDLMGNESQLIPQGGKLVLGLNGAPFFLKGQVRSVAEVPGPWKTIAESRSDFGEKQGINNWELGYYDGQGAGAPPMLSAGGFHDMAVKTTPWGYEWDGGTALMKQGVMVPAGQSWPATRWQSTVDGAVTLRGYFEVKDKKNPTALDAAIYVDGKSVFSKTLNNQREKFEITANVKRGSTIDFVAASGGPKGRCQFQAAVCVRNPAYKGNATGS